MTEITPEPGPELRIMEHDAPGTWLQDMRARGYCVPLQLCHDLSHVMEALCLPFADVFRLLWRRRKILQAATCSSTTYPAPACGKGRPRIRVPGYSAHVRREVLCASRRDSRGAATENTTSAEGDSTPVGDRKIAFVRQKSSDQIAK